MNFRDSLAVFLSAAVSSMGLGGGGILVLYLTLFRDMPQLKAQGINLLFFLPCSLVALLVYHRQKIIRFRALLLPVIGGVAGSLAGNFALRFLKGAFIPKIFACFLILAGGFSLYRALKNGSSS